MTAIAAKSARPPGAAICWAGPDGIYVEYPVKDGPPFVTRYRKTTDDLQKALNVLLENPAPAPMIQKDHPAIRRMKPAITQSEETKAAASAIVRRMLIKGGTA